jgi:putative colanic acid biosynthesis acetyltransferase WcaF
MTTNLTHYDAQNKDYARGIGASKFKQVLWFLCSVIFVRNPIHPFNFIRKGILELFGATIGEGTIIRPGVQIKYPWKLRIGRYAWIGEHSWIDNLDYVTIGDFACLSQGAMLCTGNHNYNSPHFDLMMRPIVLENGVWIAARSVVCPGVTARSHSMLTVGSVATSDLEAYGVYQGNPAQWKRNRNEEARP